MAEAFFNALAGGKARAVSAGTKPAERVNATAAAVMKETGIDISRRKPKALTFKMMEKADRVITMGCGVEETCPASFAPTEDWKLDDPEGRPVEEVRKIRDDIRARVARLVRELTMPEPLKDSAGAGER
jgi:arsenate reductase